MYLWELPPRAKQELWKILKYQPSTLQQAFHNSLARLKLVAGGERAGKSRSSAMEMVSWIFQNPRGLFWIVGPDYDQCHAEFDYTTEALEVLGLLDRASISIPKVGSWTLKTTLGGEINTRTSADETKLASVAPDGILMVETGQQTEQAYMRLRGRLAEKRAPMVLSGTFEHGLTWYAQRWMAWQSDNVEEGRSFSLPTWSNLAVFPGGENDPEILALKGTFPEDEFNERYGAIPAKPSTIVFKEFDPVLHVTNDAEYVPGERVQLWIDPGYAHAYAVLAVQIREGRVYNFDEIYEEGLVAKEMIARAKERSWWKDVQSPCVMDIAGRAHPGTESQAEIWLKTTGLWMVTNRCSIVDGILRHRTFLKDPETGLPKLFHHPRCKGTIAEYSKYVRRVEKTQSSATELPVDRFNDACVVGSTIIETPGGRRTIEEMVGEEPWVYCVVNGQIAVRRARFIRKTREQADVVKVIMDKGDIVLTPDHLVMLTDGTWVPAGSLRNSQSIMAFNRYASGDGYTRVCLTNQTRSTECEHRLVHREVLGEVPSDWHVHHKDGQPWNNTPENLEALPMDEHNTRHHAGKTISPSARERIGEASRKSWSEHHEERADIARRNVIAAHAANVGRPVAEETRALIGEASKAMWDEPGRREGAAMRRTGQTHTDTAKDKVRQAKLAYWKSEKGLAHKERLRASNMARRKDVGENHRVIAVIPWGEADVYNMEVDEAENYIAGGIVVHNCKAIAYGLVANFGYVERAFAMPQVDISFLRD